MKNYLIYILLIAFTACQDKNDSIEQLNSDENDSEDVALTEVEKVNLNMEHFSEIDSSGILMFPLGLDNNYEKERSYAKSSKNYNYGFWNIVFYNGNTSESHLLTKDKIYIQDITVYNKVSSQSIVSDTVDAIFYQVVTKDYNKDKELNDLDPTYLFISDKAGQNFRRLSPEDYDIRYWEYVKSLNHIVLSAVKDSNGDLKFDENDKVETFIISLDPNITPKEIFDTSFKRELKTLYTRDWNKTED